MPLGKLLLLPNLLDEALPHDPFLPISVHAAVHSLRGLIAESETAARRYLRRFLTHDQMVSVPLCSLNEHTPKEDLSGLIAPLLRGETWGLISDAGLPCIADPGASLVALAQAQGIGVETFVGPCSIVMALQLSGFSGQHFAFHGYLPRESADLKDKILFLEQRTKEGTQIWIEAPYRSGKMLEMLKTTLRPTTWLSVAVHLTSPNQKVVSLPIKQWQTAPLTLGKDPTIFLIASKNLS